MTGTADPLASRWFPVARSDDIAPRHIFHGRLLGHELAVWRDDGGALNVWENRCPHRGTRLTIGSHRGSELVCRYHGWRFGSGHAQCAYIPAKPGVTPPNGARVRSYAAGESAGLVWVNLDVVEGELPGVPSFPRDGLLLRRIVVRASASRVMQELTGYRFVPSGCLGDSGAAARNDVRTDMRPLDSHSLVCTATAGDRTESVRFIVQPADETKSAIHGILDASLDGASRIAVLRHHNGLLSALRDRIESEDRP